MALPPLPSEDVLPRARELSQAEIRAEMASLCESTAGWGHVRFLFIFSVLWVGCPFRLSFSLSSWTCGGLAESVLGSRCSQVCGLQVARRGLQAARRELRVAQLGVAERESLFGM